MARNDFLVERMRRNPAADWQISDVIEVCRNHGVACVAPSRGSHYKVSHPASQEILTVPFRRPIKPVYIRKLVKLIDFVERNA